MTDGDLIRIASDWARFLISGAVGGALATWAALARRDAAAARRMTGMEKRMAAVERTAPGAKCAEHVERISRLEASAGRAATHDDMRKSHERIDDIGNLISEIRAGMGELRGAMASMKGQLDRIDSFLMTRGTRQ